MPDSPEASPLKGARAKQREVVQEVAQHAESESARLLGLLCKTEDLTRQIATAEAQILRQEELQAHLRSELGTLTKRRTEVEGEAKVLATEREGAQAAVAGAEQSRAKLGAEVQKNLKDIKRLMKENEDLQREVDKYEMRKTRLEESNDHLQKARDEYLAKIESLKARQDTLSPK